MSFSSHKLFFPLLFTAALGCQTTDVTESIGESELRGSSGNQGTHTTGPTVPGQTSANIQVTLTKLVADSRGQDIVIPSNYTVSIDGDVDVGLILVEGVLRCLPGVQADIRTQGVLVNGADAKLTCGTQDERFDGRLRFILTGNRELSDIMSHGGHLMGGKAVVAMHGGEISLHGEGKKSRYVRLNETLPVGQDAITVDTGVDWDAGDEVIVTTTSFYQGHTEKFELLGSADSASLKLSSTAQYSHYGDLQFMKDTADSEVYTIDQRAYVANLTRSIVVMSEEDQYTANQVGAHMMVMHHGKAFIDAVEFFRVGQMGGMGRYPFHWHRAGNVSGQYIRNSSIHESYHRCVTIHASQNAKVIRNTCYDHFGHGYFMEEGNETKNVIKFNLGVQSKKIPEDRALLVSDFNSEPADRFPGPATYWISNPDNDIRFNVAVGSEGSGFWMAFQDYLLCSDVACTKTNASNANVTPLTTDTLEFSDNTAVASVTGITWDGAPNGPPTGNPNNPNDFALKSAHYAPSTTPAFERLEMYKNARAGLYFRGDQAHFPETKLADNGTSAFLAFNQVLRDSIFVGRSQNWTTEDFEYHFDSSIPSSWRHKRMVEGIRVYDGPFVLDNVFFAHFDTAPEYAGSKEITATPINITGGAGRYVNSVKHVTFSPAPYRKFHLPAGGNQWQDTYTASVLDIEGDLTGHPGMLLRPLHEMNDYAGCIQFPLESAQACPYEISYLRFNNTNQENFDIRRSDGPSINHAPTQPLPNPVYLNKFSMIMDDTLAYFIENYDFKNKHATMLRFHARRVGDISPIIAITSGLNPRCNLDELILEDGQGVNSIAELRNAAGTAYFGAGGKFYFKLQATQTTPKITPESPQGMLGTRIYCGN